MKKILLVGLLMFGCAFAQEQVNPMQLPQLTEYVQDFSAALSIDQLSGLSVSAKAYDIKTTNQIVTVLFPHRQGNELFDIAMKIFKDNGIGKAKTDNGLLLVIATEERKIRILVGYGLEGNYPDLMAKQVIENIRPLVDSGDFYGAVKLFYERSEQILGGEIPQGYTTSDTNSLFFILFFVGFFVIFFSLIIIGLIRNNKKKKKNTPNSSSWFYSGGDSTSDSSGDSDSGGDSGFDGGGGDSGGGGDGD